MRDAEVQAGAVTRKRPGGVVAVTVTPCRAVGQVDPEAMRRLCAMLGDRGCDGLFVLGSTGELPLLDEDDRRTLTSAARDGAGPGVLVYAGVSGTGVKQVIRYARSAAQDGADIAVVMGPFMFKFSQPELTEYLLAIADASPIPVALYHHVNMPCSLDVETVARLARHSNIVAFKDTSLDMDRLRKLVEVTAGTNMCVLQGCENLIYESLEAGAAGCAAALAGLAPEWHAELYRAYRDGDQEAARERQLCIDGLLQTFILEKMKDSLSYFTLTLKRGLQLRGWLEHTEGMMAGFEPSSDYDEALRAYLEGAGLVHVASRS